MDFEGFKQKLFSLSIMVVFALFIGYSLEAFMPGDKESEVYLRMALSIALVSGLAAIILGVYFSETVGSGLIGGGILSIIYGLLRYWEFTDNNLKAIILAISLFILVWIGLKKFSSQRKKKVRSNA